MAKVKESGSPNVKFEEALKRLEAIVQKLEEGELALDESLKIFEEGIELSRICNKKLEEAEKKIEILMKNKNGQFTKKPFKVEEEQGPEKEEEQEEKQEEKNEELF